MSPQIHPEGPLQTPRREVSHNDEETTVELMTLGQTLDSKITVSSLEEDFICYRCFAVWLAPVLSCEYQHPTRIGWASWLHDLCTFPLYHLYFFYTGRDGVILLLALESYLAPV